MPIKFLSIAAALLLVAACATESTDEGKTAGAGGSKTTGASSAPSSSVNTGSTVSAPSAGSAEEFITIGDRVYFGFNKAEIRTSDAATLNDQAAWLKKYPSITIVVEGHCDERGTREYNLALGERRANAVTRPRAAATPCHAPRARAQSPVWCVHACTHGRLATRARGQPVHAWAPACACAH